MFSIVLFFGGTSPSQSVDFEVTGKVIQGTCSFLTSDMEVKFDNALMTANIKEDINDRTYVKPFSLKYSCSDFNFSSGSASYVMKLAGSAGVSIDPENKIYPTSNLTKAAFILKSCDFNKNNCKVVDFNNGGLVSLSIPSNSDFEENFEVSVVKLAGETLKAGDLVVAVDVTFLQP